jgi:DNA polymerase-3 subunit gamma/tau
MAYQSLYRRYRPQTFSEIRGQRHVVAALQNAVVKGEVGHAYLLHGPRGTGKTTSARVLAKALNCEALGADGEPCGACESCVSIEHGRSFDLHELDAASNNKVEDMRDLLSKVNLGTPGRAKVYILDEVHMLTSQAENALLKTLEEPPAHVTWVLATTEPHKVVETIRSRCQVFELSLLPADEMAEHVRWVVADAGLDVDDDAVEYVVAAGGGSVRDTLSTLDRVVAAGGVVAVDDSTEVLLQAIAERNIAGALSAVGEAMSRGRDPRTIGETALVGLRDAFLVAMGAPSPRLSAVQRERAERFAAEVSPAAMTRAMETLGVALVSLRQAPDPRVDLEVALVRICRPESEQGLDALTMRIEALERQLAGGAVPALAPTVRASPEPSAPQTQQLASEPQDSQQPQEPAAMTTQPEPLQTGGGSPAAAARRRLAQSRGSDPAPAPVASPAADGPPPPVPGSSTARAQKPAAVDPRDLRPATPSDVVAFATEHLGMEASVVIARAKDLLGDDAKERTEDDLVRVWHALIDDQQGTHSVSEPVNEPVNEDVDLSDLVDAPDHADQVLEHIADLFPGAEVQSGEPTEKEQ